ncbi:Rrf2 family transcriptional regulator [uncultured Erythrobacter sp.]|uniref:RrF2 family transcriptional regulator n=1 Tax=uncultured Erythrobacter sp. TaxID=263913 RepID=UPI00262E9A9D|nr:Rrf2 family transcriptional regulator [uncultured Erythrobacter sp.]
MQISKGVEWTTHICTVLALLREGQGLSVDALAEFFELPAAYLAKQMQLLRRAGIVESLRGKGGGYRLARGVDAITLLDIVTAIEGPQSAFRCTEIRQNGPCGLKRADCRRPCEVASAFAIAEQAYRDALAAKTLASIMQEAAANSTPEHLMEMAGWVQRQNA